MLFLRKNQIISSNKIYTYYIYFNFKIIFIFIIILSIFIFCYSSKNDRKIKKNIAENDCLLIKKNSCFTTTNYIKNQEINNLIDENFFVIDSNNLSKLNSHLYGFIINKNGILTDNYYKELGKYEEPSPQGIYIMIRKIGNEIILNQDFDGSYGIYIYEDKNANYFAISNSFLLLQEYLIGKKNFSLNKDFANHFIVAGLCSLSIDETLINEIKQIPSNAFIIIDTKKKSFKIDYINYKENTILLESKEGLGLIDSWVDKWGYIFRSLKKQTDNISADLSGGFDTRAMLTILLNSGVEMDELNIHSILDDRQDHESDFKIASNISSKFGFKLNNFHLDNNFTQWSLKDSLFTTFYSKLGFHKQFHLKKYFFNKPRFSFSGSGGESLRGSPNVPIQEFIEIDSLRDIKGHKKEFFYSSEKIVNRSVFLLKKEKNFSNDFEISSNLYSKMIGKNHYGRGALEDFITNLYILQPLMDPDIKKIKFDINNVTCHDLIAYIYIRFAHDLKYFPFQGQRLLNLESIKKAERLNNNYRPYQKKKDYNKNFFIDRKRISPVSSSIMNVDSNYYLKELFESQKYIKIINKLYDNNVYNWANEYGLKTNYHPLEHHNSLLAIAITFSNLQLNERYLKNLSLTINLKNNSKKFNFFKSY